MRNVVALLFVPAILALAPAASAQEGPPAIQGSAGLPDAQNPGVKPNPNGPDAITPAEPAEEEHPMRAFGGADLLVGRTMKQPTGDRVFTVGLDFGVAPLDVGLSAGRDQLVSDAVNSACNGVADQATCKANADTALKSLGTVSDADWAKIKAAAGGDPATMVPLLEAAGVSPADANQIAKLVSQTSPAQRQQVVDLVHRTQSGANILFDPYIDVNLKWVDLKAEIPFTLAILNGSPKASMANVGLDVKSGYAWEWGPIGVGISGGVSMYFPTGMEGASAAQTADLFSSPKFAYGYLTVAPYLVTGVDFTWVTLQASLELDSMHGVRGDPAFTSIQYLRYGAGIVILPRLTQKWTLSIIGELNGLVPLHNADPYNALFGVAGIQARLWLIKLAVAIQMPILSHQESLGQLAGIDVGTMAGYYVLGRVAFVF